MAMFLGQGRKAFHARLRTGVGPDDREHILENFGVKAQATLTVRESDEIFISSAGIGIRQAAQFDGRSFEPSSHPILKLWPNAE